MSVFDHATQKADLWIKDVMRELGTDDPRQAYHALSASLQALRDRLTVEEAAHLAAQLPLLVRGLFYEGWRPAATPQRARHPDEIFDLIEQKGGDGHGVDPERALAATLEVIRSHVSQGAMTSLAHVLPRNLTELAR